MQGFVLRLLAPRPDFATTMTDDERATMSEHVAYWTGQAEEGNVLAFGPVADPAGGWGMGLMRVSGAEEVDGLTANDPVMLAAGGFRYEVLPMPRLVHV